MLQYLRAKNFYSWVTFINPKVDLNYFKNDPNAKDLMIIHYSDQYNLTSSGYDAITVTMKIRSLIGETSFIAMRARSILYS